MIYVMLNTGWRYQIFLKEERILYAELIKHALPTPLTNCNPSHTNTSSLKVNEL
jgi:hypothetical protein